MKLKRKLIIPIFTRNLSRVRHSKLDLESPERYVGLDEIPAFAGMTRVSNR